MKKQNDNNLVEICLEILNIEFFVFIVFVFVFLKSEKQ